MVKEYNYTLCVLRILACVLIVWNHLSNFMLGGFLNKYFWANIGVQIFFFMSGYLYGGKIISDKKSWMVRQSKKIIVPYYLCLLLMIPLIYILNREALSCLNVISALLCFQGFWLGIEGLGQHWFITYILLCYLIIVSILNRLRVNHIGGGGKFWMYLMAAALFLQIITIPLAITIHFKVAYIMTFVVGYYYKVRFSEERNFREKVKWENIVIAGSILGLVARIILDDLELAGVYEALSDLTVQYSKLFLACAIFVITNRLFSSFSWSRISQGNKKKLIVISGYTYEVYLIHEFFVHQEYTSLFDTAISVKLLIVLMSILLMTFILCKLEKLYKI